MKASFDQKMSGTVARKEDGGDNEGLYRRRTG
jgi:hypothetical protein